MNASGLQGTSIVVARIKRLMQATGPDSPHLRAALHKIGMAVQAQAVMNATRQGIVDTGSLRSHIGYEFDAYNGRQVVKIGVFGVPYAAINEFGGPFTDRMRRAMFAALKRRGKRSGEHHGKGVIVNGYYKARPYLIPAFKSQREYIVDTLRQALIEAARGGK